MAENKTIEDQEQQSEAVKEVQKDPRQVCETKGRVLRRQISASDEEAATLLKKPRQTAQADPDLEEKLDPPTAFDIQRLDQEDAADLQKLALEFDIHTVWWDDSYVLINWAPTETSRHGKWKNLINVTNGEIVGVDNTSEAHDALELHWSDVAFIQWMNECQKHQNTTGQPASDLRYVFRHNITNDTTKYVIKGILNKRKQFHDAEESESWMECEVSPDSPDGLALLGTPNGVGVAYLLIQHKKEFGSNRIGSIDIMTVFNDPDLGTLHEEQRSYALRFHIVEAKPEVPTGIKRKAMEGKHEEETTTKKR